MANKTWVFHAVCWALLAGPELRAADAKPTPWPDLSEPKAAAFSLGVALILGDEKTAKEIYIGKDKEFFATLEALVSARKSYDRFARVATARFGKNAAALVTSNPVELKFGGIPLTTLLATARVEQQGRRATLTPTLEGFQEVHFRLQKVEARWKVSDFPLNPLVAPFAEMAVSVLDKVTQAMEQGKYGKAYEVCEALEKLGSPVQPNQEKKGGTQK